MSGHLIVATASSTTDVAVDIDGYVPPVSGSTRRSTTGPGGMLVVVRGATPQPKKLGWATGHVHGVLG